MPGRRATPTAAKRLRGNPGRRPLNEREPQPGGKLGAAPGWLSAGAKRHWKEKAPQLEATKVGTKIDRDALARLCVILDLMEQAAEDLKAGPLVKGKRNPAVNLFLDLSKEARQYMGAFGLEPSSRTKLHIEPARELTEMEKLLAETEQGKGGVN